MDIAYLVACENYENGIPKLNSSINDLKVMYEVFSNYCGVSAGNIICFCDGDGINNTIIKTKTLKPKRDEILHKLFEDSQIKNNGIDNLFFYYSGHGYINSESNFCIVPTNSAKPLEAWSITDKQLVDHLMNFKAKHIILIFDACRSFYKEKSIDGIKTLPNSVVTFYSCTIGSKAYIPTNENISIFTKCFSEAFGKKGKCTTVGEVGDYLDERLKKLCAEYNIGDVQIPQIKVEDVSLRNIVLAKAHHEYVPDFTQEEIIIMDKFIDQIDLNNASLLVQYGCGVVSKIVSCNDLEETLKINYVCEEINKFFGKLFHEYNKYCKTDNFFCYLIRKLLYKEEKELCRIDKEWIKNYFRDISEIQGILCKNIASHEKMIEICKNYLKETSMYIKCGNRVCENNKQHKNFYIMKKRINLLEDCRLTFEENIKLLDKQVNIYNELLVYCDRLGLIFSKLNNKISNTVGEDFKKIKKIHKDFYNELKMLYKEIISVMEQ